MDVHAHISSESEQQARLGPQFRDLVSCYQHDHHPHIDPQNIIVGLFHPRITYRLRKGLVVCAINEQRRMRLVEHLESMGK
jgi:hypothetical protein